MPGLEDVRRCGVRCRRRLHAAAQALDGRQQDGHEGLLEEKGIGAAVDRRLAIGVFGVHGDDNDLGRGALRLDLPLLLWCTWSVAPGIAVLLYAILVPMEHDASYKLLFSHARMVEDLLRGFVHEAWVRDVDWTTLERVSDSQISDDLRSRRDDLVWRVRWGPDWLYLSLLLECQSTVDAYMAVRVLVYVGLLYQALIRAGQLPPSGTLPPVVPIVLYNPTTSL